jgi:hypothetical protein
MLHQEKCGNPALFLPQSLLRFLGSQESLSFLSTKNAVTIFERWLSFVHNAVIDQQFGLLLKSSF